MGLHPGAHERVRLIGPTRYLDNARAVVTHTLDDATRYLPRCLDAVDRRGVKATIFVNTGAHAGMRLWPRLRQAVADGHEIGAHSRSHRCGRPDTLMFCLRALSRDEIEGARDDILANTDQPHVWAWAYPCGHCADRRFVQRRVARAGYVTARAYPERGDQHLVPNLQTWDLNPYAARYTQVAQQGYAAADGRAVPGRTDPAALNAKFDEVYDSGGIYTFVTHPQFLDGGSAGFYERHLAHVSARHDVWYVPMGPLYAYRALWERISISPAQAPPRALAAFAVATTLDQRVYDGSVTFEVQTAERVRVIAGGRVLSERPAGPVDRWRGQYVRRTGHRLWVTVRPNAIVELW